LDMRGSLSICKSVSKSCALTSSCTIGPAIDGSRTTLGFLDFSTFSGSYNTVKQNVGLKMRWVSSQPKGRWELAIKIGPCSGNCSRLHNSRVVTWLSLHLSSNSTLSSSEATRFSDIGIDSVNFYVVQPFLLISTPMQTGRWERFQITEL
jgi:hypothetical protein